MDPLMAGSLDLDRIRIASRHCGESRNCVPALKNSVGNAPSRPPSRGGGRCKANMRPIAGGSGARTNGAGLEHRAEPEVRVSEKWIRFSLA